MSMFEIDKVENYAALWIAIENGLESADVAFKMLDKALKDPFKKRRVNQSMFVGVTVTIIKRDDLTDADIENMISLREKKVTYKDIGVMYCMTDKAVYQRIKNYKLKKEKQKAS